jgi:ribosomal protein S18 acetylase RimI-like enzyme
LNRTQIAALAHTTAAVAAEIHAVMALAYAQEAQLLQVRDFPPLAQSVADVQARQEFVIGARIDDELLGVVCVGPDDELQQLCITALVVHPKAQRQGIARQLLLAVFARGPGTVFAVATAADNAPALALYAQLGFVVYRQGAIGPEQLALVKLRRSV